ncbi:MAG: OmpA family protein [Chitinophagales bacterium]|nr:OmpA family protein [Bacteroidota bacterium]
MKPKYQDQQEKFLDGKYNYPAKPRNKTELGIDIGSLYVSGDIKARSWFPGLGIGGHIRRSLGYVFSVRGSIMAGTTYGMNWEGSQGWSGDGNLGGHFAGPGEWVPNPALGGDDGRYYAQFNDQGTPDYRGLNNNVVFYNYKTQIREAVISGIVNLNNIKFHKRRNRWNLYGIFGIGGFLYNTTMDQLNANGEEYDYSGIAYGIDEQRKDAKQKLKDLWDGDYESQAEKHRDDYWILGVVNKDDNKWSYRPTAHVGIGVAVKLSNTVNLGLESKVTYTNDDLVDGQRWQEWGALTREYDTYVFTNASLNFNLGRKNSVEPLWWMNPIDYTASKDDCCDDFKLADADGDGVPDMFDEEPDSRKDCPVDTRGRMLDSDGDGVLDCDDCQPHTPRHLIDKINDCGAAFEACCRDTLIIERVIEAPRAYKAPCDAMGLPNVLFDLNHYGLRPEFDAQLQAVASYMNANPDVRLCVVGHTDNRSGDAYNNVLSWKRANEVANKLSSQFGIPRNRLVVQYSGEGNPVVAGLADSAAKKGIDAQHALNRRVDFKCCMEGQYDMPMPDGPRDAGVK